MLWEPVVRGPAHFLELFSGSAHASAAVAQQGMAVAPPVDLRTGFDLNTQKGQKDAWKIIYEQKPLVVFMAPVCSPWSLLMNAQPEWKRKKKQKEHMPMVRFCIDVACHQLRVGCMFIIENPEGSRMWQLPEMQRLAATSSVTWDTLNMCAFGMKDTASKLPFKKAVSLMHNLDPAVLTPLFRKCTGNHHIRR